MVVESEFSDRCGYSLRLALAKPNNNVYKRGRKGLEPPHSGKNTNPAMTDDREGISNSRKQNYICFFFKYVSLGQSKMCCSSIEN